MSSAIADDVLLKRLEAVPNEGNDSAPLNINRGGASAFVQSFEGLVDHWVGYLVLLSQDNQDSSDNLSRSAAVRVDNITEVIAVLEVLFKR